MGKTLPHNRLDFRYLYDARWLYYPPKHIKETGEIVFHNPTSRFSPGSVCWWKPGQGVTAVANEPNGVFTNSTTAQDYIKHWIPLDQDRLIGVRSQVLKAEDGTHYIEIWEAQRNGEIRLYASYPVPDTVTQQEGFTQLELKQIGSNGELIILEYWMPDLFGSIHEYYFLTMDNAGNWTIADMNNMPASCPLDSQWKSVTIVDWSSYQVSSNLVGYITIGGVVDPEADSEDTDHYSGIFSGSILDGTAGFTQLAGFCTMNGVAGTALEDQPISTTMLLPFDGSTVFQGSKTYITNADGEITHEFYPPGCRYLNFYWCRTSTYYTKQGMQPGW